MLEIATEYAPVSALSPDENKQVIKDMIDRYRRFWGYEISREAIEMWNDYALRFDLIEERVPFESIVYAGAPVCAEMPCR